MRLESVPLFYCNIVMVIGHCQYKPFEEKLSLKRVSIIYQSGSDKRMVVCHAESKEAPAVTQEIPSGFCFAILRHSDP